MRGSWLTAQAQAGRTTALRVQTSLVSGFVLAVVLLGTLVFTPQDASAHRSGCHAAHSCSSDTGSYTCGDTGNYRYCGGSNPSTPAPDPTVPKPDPVAETSPSPSPAIPNFEANDPASDKDCSDFGASQKPKVISPLRAGPYSTQTGWTRTTTALPARQSTAAARPRYPTQPARSGQGRRPIRSILRRAPTTLPSRRLLSSVASAG